MTTENAKLILNVGFCLPATGTPALTFDKLTQLVADVRKLLSELCESVVPDDELVIRCEQLLMTAKLDPVSLIARYLVTFEQPRE